MVKVQFRKQALMGGTIVGLLSIVVASTTALAGDGSCPWNHLSAVAREQALIAGEDGGPAALASSIGVAQFAAIEAACGISPSNSDALRRAESGYMLQVLAERWLGDHAHLSSKTLDLAWNRMDASAKARIEDWTNRLNHDPEDHDLAYRAFLSALGYPADLPTDVKPRLLTYLQGRSFRAVFEPRF